MAPPEMDLPSPIDVFHENGRIKEERPSRGGAGRHGMKPYIERRPVDERFNEHVRRFVSDSVRVRLGDNLRDSMELAIRQALDESIRDQLASAIRDAIAAQEDDQFDGRRLTEAIYAGFFDTLRTRLGESVRIRLGKVLRARLIEAIEGGIAQALMTS